MKGILFFTVLAAVAAVAADESQFSVRGSAPGNLEFSGGGQTIEWEFRNRGAFAGECVEVIRLSGFAGDGETPHRKQLSLRADTIRKHTMTIPAKLSGPFSIRYSLLRDGRVLYTREIRGETMFRLRGEILIDPFSVVTSGDCGTAERRCCRC